MVLNNALIELLVEEESINDLRHFIERSDAFDQLGLANKLEKHDSLEFRRLASYLYRKNKKYKQAIGLSKKDKYFDDAIEGVMESKDQSLSEDLLSLFADKNMKEYFCAISYLCYEYLRADVVLELAWKKGWTDFTVPFMCQTLREYSQKISTLEKDAAQERKEKEMFYENSTSMNS